LKRARPFSITNFDEKWKFAAEGTLVSAESMRYKSDRGNMLPYQPNSEALLPPPALPPFPVGPVSHAKVELRCTFRFLAKTEGPTGQNLP